MTTIQRNLSRYTRINLADDIEASVAVGNVSSFSIAVHENIAEYLNVHVEDEILFLSFKSDPEICNSNAKAEITVTEPLRGASSTGSGSLSIDRINGSVVANGSGSVTVDTLDGISVFLLLSGSNNLVVHSGQVSDFLNVTNSGSGNLTLGSLRTSNATIGSFGTGNVDGMVSVYLQKVTSIGNGNINTTATDIGDVSCSGGGHIYIAGGSFLGGIQEVGPCHITENDVMVADR